MKPSRVLATALALMAGAAVFSVRTGAQQAPGVPAGYAALEAAGRVVPHNLIVQFRADATASDKARLRARLGARVASRAGRDPLSAIELETIPSSGSLDNALSLASRNPAVAFAEPNWIYTHQDTPDDPYFTNGSLYGMYGNATSPFANPWGTQVMKFWNLGATGNSSVMVGVIDEGIDYTHPDLAPNIWTNPYDPPDGIDNDNNGFIDDIHGWDFFEDNNTIFDGGPGSNVDRHGTHVSGTIGAASNGAGVVGINWHVGIISAKFLGPQGGSTTDAVSAVDYLTGLKTLHPALNIVATNNSWGGGGYSQSLHDALIRAANAGILFVAAAGNQGANNDTVASYPSNYNTSVGTTTQAAASYDSVIAVAAICGAPGPYRAAAGGKASFSNYGATTVDLGAPGVNIYSTLPNNSYGALNGTSMATPHVTGAAALLASLLPGVSPSLLRLYVLASAYLSPTPSLSGITVYNGRLNFSVFIAWPPGTAPSALGATPVSPGQINLQWTDNSPDEVVFSIERCPGSSCSNFAEIALVGANVMSYADTTGLAPNTTYSYRVRGIRGDTNSGYSLSDFTPVTKATTLP